MSVIVDCSACEVGDHENHDPETRGTMPGLIGGYVCCCTGDCKERYDERWERFWAKTLVPIDRAVHGEKAHGGVLIE